MTNKGNSDGMTMRRHRSIPSTAPFCAVLESMININIAVAIIIKDQVRFCNLKTITSEESMRRQAKLKQACHRMLERGDRMRPKNKLADRIVLGADLPGEHLPGVPVIEISGEGRVLIENHKGVTAYGCKEICVGVRFGMICVCGGNLELARITKHQLVITGRIDSVSLQRRRC